MHTIFAKHVVEHKTTTRRRKALVVPFAFEGGTKQYGMLDGSVADMWPHVWGPVDWYFEDLQQCLTKTSNASEPPLVPPLGALLPKLTLETAGTNKFVLDRVPGAGAWLCALPDSPRDSHPSPAF